MLGEARLGLSEALAHRFDAFCAQLLILALRKDETCLPVFVAFEQNENAATTDAAECAAADLRLAGKLGQAKPENIHGRRSFFRLDAGELAEQGKAAIGADGEPSANFVWPIRCEVADAAHSIFFDEQVLGLRVHAQLEVR